MISVFPAFPYGRMHYRSLERCKVRALRKSSWCFDESVQIDRSSILDLHWWVHNILSAWAPICRNNPKDCMTVDASKKARGASF